MGEVKVEWLEKGLKGKEEVEGGRWRERKGDEGKQTKGIPLSISTAFFWKAYSD